MIRIALLFGLIVCNVLVAEERSTSAESSQSISPIEEYVHRPDASYKWHVVNELPAARGTRVAVIDMTSQTWRSSEEVNQPEWRHWLIITYPEKVRSNIGFLFIGGGSNRNPAPNGPSNVVRQIAEATGTVVAELKMVPNQPLIFHKDGQPRVEDDLIGYTWDQYLKTGDPNWVARNPMVKSAVRAMDTVTAFMKTKNQTVDSFVVAGGSKRGWTTWLTGAFDKRVVGIIPIVIDVLNADRSMRHHFGAYGFWAPAIGNYVQHGIMTRIDHPRLKELYRLVDPYYHLDRLQMPKFIVNAAGDQFFLPDSSQFYWDDLKGPKYLRYVPNADHGLDGSDAVESVAAFYAALVQGKELPKYSWETDSDGAIHVKSEATPKEVRLWHATNPEARDFRMETLGKKYQSELITPNADGEYVGKVAKPESGWTAYFVELTYDLGLPVPLKLTTGVEVIPDVIPFKDRNPSLEGTVTVVCEGKNESAAKAIAATVKSVIEAAKLPIRAVTTQCVDSTIYVNFKPESSNPVGAVEKITAWLAEQGCSDFRYQLESGQHITTPPVAELKSN